MTIAMPTTATTTATTTANDLPALLADLRATRVRAQSALDEVRRAKAESEARLAHKPGGDTYKRVAGISSLERAAIDAQRIIASVDRQLASLSPIAEVKSPTAWSNAR